MTRLMIRLERDGKEIGEFHATYEADARARMDFDVLWHTIREHALTDGVPEEWGGIVDSE